MDTVPTRKELLNPTLAALRSLGGSASIHEIVTQVTQDLSIPARLVDIPHGDGRRTELEYQLAWARTYLKKYGLLVNSERGVWSLTPAARNVSHIDPDEAARSLALQEKNSRQTLPNDIEVSDEQDPMDEDPKEVDPSWRQTLLAKLQAMPPDAFERLCQRLLRESGFIAVEVTGKSGDGGIDGHGVIRLAGLISFPVLFQCKRHRGSVGASVVRDFRGAMVGRADKGLILTTGTFTRDAQREATRDGAPPIDLIDAELLLDRLKETRLGITTRMVEVVDLEFFDSV